MLHKTKLIVAAVLSAALLAACGSSGEEPRADSGDTTTDSRFAGINTSPDQDRIVPDEVPEIAQLVPQEIRDRGRLRVATPVPGGGWPPSQFVADDNRTVIGLEPDVAQLVAGVFGLELEILEPSWEQLFLGIDKGDVDAAFSYLSVTEERKRRYDFATYRLDKLAWEAAAEADFTIDEPADIVGRTIATDTGTNQEKLLLAWNRQLSEQGLEPAKVKYYPRTNQIILALRAGTIDAYLTAHPDVAYRAATAGDTKVVGTLSGGGEDARGFVGAVTRKGSGLAAAIAAAVDHTIESGEYAEAFERWQLGEEAVEVSEVNPRGLPLEPTS